MTNGSVNRGWGAITIVEGFIVIVDLYPLGPKLGNVLVESTISWSAAWSPASGFGRGAQGARGAIGCLSLSNAISGETLTLKFFLTM